MQTCASTVHVARPLGRSARTGLASSERRSGFLAQPGRLQRGVRHVCRAQSGKSEAEAPARQQELGESPFLEPFLRSMLLGMGTAALLESAHVTLQFLSGVAGNGLQEAVQALPPPLFLADHVAAIGGWLAFYLIEAVAIAAVLKSYAGDQAAAMPTIRKMATLPKKMLPVKLQLLKQLLGINSSPALAAAGTSAAAAAPTSSSSGGSPAAGLPAASAFVADNEATAVLPTPQHPRTLPLPKASAAQAQQPQTQRQAGGPHGPNRRPEKPSKEGSNIVPGPTTAGGTLQERRQSQSLQSGQLDAETMSFLKREKQLLHRRSYPTNVWYHAGFSKDIKEGQPYQLKMVDKQFVLYRDVDGSLVCLDNVCPHRGAPLSGGWLSEMEGHNCVVCPYHAWAFDGQGRLRDVPAAEHKDEWPKRQLLSKYDVVEKGGIVWLFYGDSKVVLTPEQRMPIPYAPELDDPLYKGVFGKFEMSQAWWSVFQNLADVAHVHYLHGGSFGNEGEPKIENMRVVGSDTHSVTVQLDLHNKPVNVFWEWTKVPVVRVTAQVFFPFTSKISFELANGLKFITFVSTAPVTHKTSVNHFSLIRSLGTNILGPAFNADIFDSAAVSAMIKILSEDKAMVEQLRPGDQPHELSVRADLPQIEHSKMYDAWAATGQIELNKKDKEIATRAKLAMLTGTACRDC